MKTREKRGGRDDDDDDDDRILVSAFFKLVRYVPNLS